MTTTPHHGLPDLLALAGGTGSWREAIASVSDAYLAAQPAVIQLAAAGGARLRERPGGPEISEPKRCAQPPAGGWAAQILPEAVAQILPEAIAQILPEAVARIPREHAERARGDGITWEQIGEALGLDQGPDGESGYDLGVAAFEYFTGMPDPWYRASFRFRCASCGGHIIDRGPFGTHPDDNEYGHAEGCVRLAADIAGWQAQWDAWEAEDWEAQDVGN